MTPARPSLLFYAPSLGDGGAERLWAALATQFHLSGFDVHFARDLENDDARPLLHKNIPVTTLGAGHRQSLRDLTALLKQMQPDVALTAVAASGPKLLIARARSGTSTKVIQTVHGHNEWKTGWASFLTAATMMLSSRVAERTVAVSEPLRERLIRRWWAKRDATIAITNPVVLPKDIPALSRADLSARHNAIVAVGRLTADKDYATLIDALALIDRPDVSLTLVGKGPEEHALRQQIQNQGLGQRITLTGYVADPSPYYLSAKCLALSSRTETFGNVIVEALAHGLPVVATDTDGPRLILNAHELGTRVPVGDAHALADALCVSLDQPGDPEPRQMRAQDFAMENGFKAYKDLVTEVMLDQTLSNPSVLEPRSVKETNNVSG